MPRVGRLSRTSTTSAGPSVISTSKTYSSRFGHLKEMVEEDGVRDSTVSSTHSNYDFSNDSDTVASLKRPIFASGGNKKPKKKKGKGMKKTLEPSHTSLGVSNTPSRQEMESESFLEDEEQQIENMPQIVAEKIVGLAVMKVM